MNSNGLPPVPLWNPDATIEKGTIALRNRFVTAPIFADAIAATLLAGVAIFFFLGLLAFALKDGLCCGDDAYLAQVAKNLAFGAGYSTSTSTSIPNGISPFDPAINSGPVVILPAALLIRLLGNLTWVPGLTTILTVYLLGLSLFLVHLRRERLWQASLYMLTFGTISYAATSPILTQWYTMFGELPAALISVLGISLVAIGSRRAVSIGTVVLGCAIQAKLLALLLCVPTLFWIVLTTWRRDGYRSAIGMTAKTTALFLLPETTFLFWQLLSLGTAHFIQIQIATIAFISEHPGNDLTEHGMLSRIAVNFEQFASVRGFSLTMMAAFASITGLTVWRYGTSVDRRRAALLFTGSALHFIWWLGSSNGWRRYAITGLVAYAAGVAIVIVVRRRALGLGLAGLFITTHLSLANHTDSLLQMLRPGGFDPSERVQHLREATNKLAELSTERPFVTGFWAPMVDLEYMLPDSRNFVPHVNLPPAVASRPFILAYNRKWLEWVWQPGFPELNRQCVEIFAADPYYIKRCPPQAAGPPIPR